MYLLEKFVTVKPGEPYRLFPFGVIYKDGKKREFTPEFAQTVSLPHFRPPIKLGSHAETTPAGGFIIGLEVRPDGLYAIPEFNEVGTSAVATGAYRYHSPEIVWEGGYENPQTGGLIPAPLIVGDALLHTPHLGEAVALYSVKGVGDVTEITEITETTVSVPLSWLDRLLNRQPGGTSAPSPTAPDDYSAQVEKYEAELAEARGKVERYEAMQARAGRVAQYAADFKNSPAVKEDTELHLLLADIPAEVADKLVVKFKALSAQINESALTGELGNAGGQPNGDPAQRAEAVIRKYMTDNKVDYNTAISQLARMQPDLFKGVI